MKAEISRRSLMKTSALGSLALASSAFTLPFSQMVRAAEAPVEEKAVWSSCTVNCGSRCLLRLHVKDDTVYWVESDTTGDDVYGNHQVRACLRGRSIRRRMNHPDRLKYPMKRVGKRGEGKFERISWDEALDTISDNLRRILKDYGNEAVHVLYGTGVDGGNITNSNVPYRLMNSCGGFLSRYGSYSTAQISAAMSYMFGANDGNSPDDIANTKLVVMFGNNPAETRMSGGGVTYYVEQARERSNARMIVIDPRYNDTAAGREDEWLPIRPGTDGALACAIAWVLITENMVDQPFLDKYCVGYDEKTLPANAPRNAHYKAYILGEGPDGIAKTPEWAAKITSIPAEKIIQLAREIGSAKPAYICQGWGPQRHSNGEQTSRAIAMLSVLTGNVGINGGNGYTTLAFFLTVLLSGPILAAAILRAARVTFNTTPFAIISVLALIACAGVIVLQGLSLASIHSSVQQASALVPDYASLQVWRVVLLCAGLGCWLCPLIRRREPHVAGLILGLILILGGEMIGRVLFYGLHMTVGMAIAG